MIPKHKIASFRFGRRSAIAALSGAAMLMLTGAAPWSSTVSRTSIGAHLIGNPAAKVRLVEYFSYTCGACGQFANTATAPLNAQYVNSGKALVEYRNLVRDPVDMTAALLARCGRANAFYGNHQAIFAAQATWLGKVQKATEAQQKSWYEGSPTERTKRLAVDSGLFGLMRARGYSDAQLDVCLASEVSLAELTGMTNIGRTADHVRGTPSFFVNGKRVDSIEWTAVKSALDAALKGA